MTEILSLSDAIAALVSDRSPSSQESNRHQGPADARHLLPGLTIAAGTKPLHDLITSLQNKSTPATGSSADGD